MSEPYIHHEADPEKPEAGSLTETSPFMRWLDNFWYHNKWTVLIVTFFLVVGIICIAQFFTRPTYDATVLLGSSYRVNSAEYADLEKLLEKLCPDDFDGNGEVSVNILVYQVYSEEEYLAEKESLEAESEQFEINMKFNQDELKNFDFRTGMTGDCTVCILSPYLYSRLLGGDRLMPLDLIYTDGELPVGAREDERGIDLSETDFYRYNPAAHSIPENGIICIPRPTVNTDEQAYDEALRLFCAIADFRVAEE